MKTKMQSLLPLAVILLILSLPQPLSGTDPGSDDPFLWEAHMNACTILVAGIVHVGKLESYPVHDKYIEKLLSADKIIFEIAEDFETINEKQLKYIQKDRLPEDKYFRNTLDSGTKMKLIEILGEDKFHEYDQYNAWVLILHLAVNKLKLLGYDPALAVDKIFREQAVKSGKEIIGLETVEEQLDLFVFDLPYDIQLKIIKQSTANIQTSAEEEALLCDAYYKNQVVKFGEIFNSRFDSEDQKVNAVYNKIYANRNIAWANHLDELASQHNGTLFVAVGAGHLFGPGNLLECLKEKGYAINQFENPQD